MKNNENNTECRDEFRGIINHFKDENDLIWNMKNGKIKNSVVAFLSNGKRLFKKLG